MTGRPIGIFARTFPGTEPGAVLAAARDAGYDCVQLNLSSAGLPAMPDAVPPEVEGRVVAAARTASVAITALSGTYNMIHPDPAERVRGLRRLGVVLRTAARIGAHPLIGAERPVYAPTPYRFLALRGFPYLLVHDAAAAPPRILRVVHGARDLPGLLAALRG